MWNEQNHDGRATRHLVRYASEYVFLNNNTPAIEMLMKMFVENSLRSVIVFFF